MKLSNYDFGWFDLVVVAAVIIGAIRGRKRGMSEELLDLMQWGLIVGVGGYGYKPLGQFLLGQVPVLSRTLAFVLSYIAIAMVLHLVFSWMKRSMGQKLLESEVFGDMEYYLGVVAGSVRFCCMLLFALALVNAKYVSDADKAAIAKMQRDNFGSISFPTIGSLQQSIFEESYSGKQVKTYCGSLLIKAGAEDRKPREGLGRQRENAVDEIMKGK